MNKDTNVQTQEKPARKPRVAKETTADKKANKTLDLNTFEGINEVLKTAIKDLEKAEKIDLDGKLYTTVAVRVKAIREALGFRIKMESKPIHVSDLKVMFSTSISVYINDTWHLISTGHSEEYRASHDVNKVAALENAETSSVGRALGNLGLMGNEFASANELDNKGIKNNVAKLKEILNSDKTINIDNYLKKFSLAKIEAITDEVAEKMIALINKDKKTKKVSDTNQIKEEVGEDSHISLE